MPLIKKLSLSILVTFFAFTAFGQCEAETYTGQGTYYNYTGGGNCSYPRPYNTLYAAALNAAQYGAASLCGACAEVTGQNGTLIVSLEDQCPECAFGDLDLEADAFQFIADPILGRVPISWKIVPCPVSQPVAFYIKEGSSQFWIAIQVRNHRYPVTKIEVFTDGSFTELPRANYNYFEKMGGLGVGPYTFRITDYFGQVIIEENIPLLVTTEIPGKNQFPVCGVVSGVPVPFKERPYVYPNPATIGNTSIINPTGEKINFELVNLLGQTIADGSVEPNARQELMITHRGPCLLIIKSGEMREIIKLSGY